MRIQISGKHMDTGEALKEYVETNIQKSVGKYFDSAIDAVVVFSKKDHFVNCHITVNEGVKNGAVITAEDETADTHTSFDSALTKAEKQLRRYKRKLKDRSGKVSLAELSAQAANG